MRRTAAMTMALAAAQIGGASAAPASAGAAAAPPDMVAFFDVARRRTVPVALYGYRYGGRARPLALISHGYGGQATGYGFLADALVRRGFLVAAIQHVELPGDPAMANDGDIAQRRRPVWRIGADSIGFVARQLRASGMADPATGLVVIGHSNGGDMTMLFAAEHPGLVAAALSLDNRRMPLPRTAQPRICSIRSNDQPADAGVLPDAAERARFGMVVAPAPVAHDAMGDAATEPQRRAMLRIVAACLKGVTLRRPG